LALFLCADCKAQCCKNGKTAPRAHDMETNGPAASVASAVGLSIFTASP
jgi:hypothetical protein